jgi:pimeloyl-ACP methyl ester carboxylesterase
MQAVADAAGVEKFALLGLPGAGGMTSLEFAARHPDRVTHLVLFQAVARGPLHRSSQGSEYVNMTLSLIAEAGEATT